MSARFAADWRLVAAWARRDPNSPLVFHRNGIAIRRWRTACRLSGATPRCLKPGCSERIGNSRRTRAGELFRAEAKSMNMGADESKAHFDELAQNIRLDDLLVVIAWRWELDGERNWPAVREIFLDRALPIAQFRDALHLARGGTFVDRAICPDECQAQSCSHHGEPLNSNGKRERLSGPESRRVSANVSHAANFGGLVRMLAARGQEARATLEVETQENAIGRSYIEFIRRNEAE